MLVLGFWLAALGGGEADLTDSRAAFLRSRHIPATPLEMALRLERELARGAGILMPDPERRVRLDGGVIALDAGQAGFPPEFLAGLVPEEINGVEAWRATLCADDLSGGMLFYNAAGEPFWSVAADPAVYTPDWIAKLHSVDGAVPDFSDTDRVYQDLLARPSRRMQTPDQVFYRSAWLSTRQYFLPSHTEMTFVFLLREDLDDYRSGMAANRQGAALAGAPAHSSATLTGLAFTGIASGTNGVALSAAWPTGTVLAGGALDVFFTPTLAPPAWTNPWRVAVDPDADGVDLLIPRADMPPPPEAPAPACVTNTAPSNYDPGVTYTNTICTNAFWLADTGFFRLADLADTDGDGLTDANENWVHGTSPTNPDTDGDGLPDGWELDHGLNPLTNDALSDLDNDRVPAVYEFHYGTNPNHADSHLIPMLRVDPAAAATNTAFHASLAAAFAASAPYAVIEVADGLYSGPDNAGLWFPVHPVLLMSEDWGASRRATVTYDGNLAAFYMNAHQDNRTIVRGLNLRLGGATAYQIGFWLGDGNFIAPDKGAAPVFEGVAVELGASDVNVGFFCRHSAPGAARFENCVICGKGMVGKPLRGIYAVDSPALRLINCTLQNFSPEPYSYGIQFESTPGNYGSADNPVDVDIINCIWDESFAHPNVHAFVRLQDSVIYDVSMTNCLVPRALDWFPPDTCSGLLVTNANLALGGHLRSGSPAINAGYDAAPRLDFEGQVRDSLPDIGADEYGGFAAGDSDGDGISDAAEVETHGTNPYATDSDGDGLDDGTEVALGSDPANPFSFRVTVLGSVTNRTGASAPVRACYGWNEGVWHAATATNVAADGTFVLDVFSNMVNSGAWVNVFCDFNANGTVDAATEPVYSQAVIVTGACHRMHFDLRDWDGDGIPDWDEVQCGTDPLAATNYCVTILGAATNIAISSGLFRAGASLTADGSGMLAETDVAPAGGFVLPHVRVSAAGALHVHLYDDLNDNGELDASDVLATQDLSITGLVTAIIFDGKLAYCDNDGDGMPDFWEARHGLSWTNAADACDNPDGDGLINLHEYWCRTDPEVADGAQYALSDAALAIDSRIAGRNPTNALPLFENYIANGTNGVFIRNADCWAADLDLTCCSPWNGETWYGKNMMAGTLISPRHVLFAAHFAHISINSTMTFVDRQNNIITRELVAKMQHWEYTNNPVPYPDITVGLLDADVPTNQISFARVLPDNYADYIRTGARLPAIRLDQEEKALIGDVRYVSSEGPRFSASCMLPVDSMRLAFFENVIKYDSGNPAFIFIDGQPILLTVWTGPLAGSGTSVTAFKGDINQLMSDLGGGYQLTEVDLTGFTPLP